MLNNVDMLEMTEIFWEVAEVCVKWLRYVGNGLRIWELT